MRRALWLVPPAAILALLYLGVLWGELDEPTGPGDGAERAVVADGVPYPPLREAPGDVELRGRPGATEAPPPTAAPGPAERWRQWEQAHRGRHRWAGVVRTADGRPIPGAGVHQLKRQQRSRAWSAGVLRATADAEGHFVLPGYPPAETRFVVTATGFVTAWLEGEDVRTDQELVFVLDEAPRLRVRFVDEGGEPVDYGGVRVVRLGGRDLPERGLKHLRPRTQYEVANAEGVADFHFDSLDPVMVIPEIEGQITEPAEQWLPEPRGAVTFIVRAGTLLVVTATEAGGVPVTGPVWVVICDRSTGHELTTFRSAGTDHVADMDLELPSGTYAVEVTVEGREPVLIPDVELPSGGARVEQTVTMAKLGEPAVLRIEAAVDPTRRPSDGGPKHSALAPPRLLVRRRDGAWAALGWRPHGDVRWRAKQAGPDVTLRPGTYDLILSLPSREQVAVLEDVALEPGARVTRRVTARPGLEVRLYDLLPADLAVRSLRLESARYGRLPVIGRFLGARLQEAGGLVDVIAPPGSPIRSQPEAGPWLGPYPGSFTLVVEDWSGGKHRFPSAR